MLARIHACRALLAAFAVLGAGTAAHAQSVEPHEGRPDAPVLGDGPSGVAPLGVVLEAPVRPRRVRVPRLNDEDVETLGRRGAVGTPARSYRVALVRRLDRIPLPERPADSDATVRMPDGTLAWTFEAAAPGAVGLRLHVCECDLPAGAEVICYDADEPTESYGPWTGRGPHGDGSFYTPTVFGERARIEVRLPKGTVIGKRAFAVDAVVQQFVEGPRTHEDASAAHKAGNCHNNVACDSAYLADQSRSVTHISGIAGGFGFLCSGCLISDTDDTTDIAWVVTANHCVPGEAVARTVECYWDYRSSSCGGSGPSLSNSPRTLGATFVEGSSRIDGTLLRLTGVLPPNRFFAGWSLTTPPFGSNAVGVHHPAGDHMRISYGQVTSRGPDRVFVQWNSGVTEGGSSGSPLFDGTRNLVGMLSGGGASCSNPSGQDNYGRFDRLFIGKSLERFLLVGDAGAIGDDWDPFDDKLAGASLLQPPVGAFAEHGPHSLAPTDGIDWYRVPVVRGGTYAFEADGGDAIRVDTFIGTAAGEVVARPTGDTVPFTYRSRRTDTLWLRVRSRGSAPLEYALRASNVTTPPVPVTDLTAAVDAKGRVRIRWRDTGPNATRYVVERKEEDAWVFVKQVRGSRRKAKQRPGPGAGAHVYRVSANNPAGSAHAELDVDVVGLDDDGNDPADDRAPGATVLATDPGSVSGPRTLSGTDLADWYRLDLEQGRSYRLSSTGKRDVDATLFAEDDPAEPVASDRNSGKKRNFDLTFAASTSGAYLLRVTTGRPGRRAAYELSVVRLP